MTSFKVEKKICCPWNFSLTENRWFWGFMPRVKWQMGLAQPMRPPGQQDRRHSRANDGQATFLEKSKGLRIWIRTAFLLHYGSSWKIFSHLPKKKHLKRVANASTNVLASSFNPIEYHHEIGPFSYFFYFLFPFLSSLTRQILKIKTDK